MLTRILAAAALLTAYPALAQDAPATARQSLPPQAERELRAADDVDHQEGPQLPEPQAEAVSTGDDDDDQAEALDEEAEDATDGDEETEAERPDDI